MRRNTTTHIIKILQYFHYSNVDSETRANLIYECGIVRFNNFIKWDKNVKAYELLVQSRNGMYKLNPIVMKKMQDLLPTVYAK